MAHWRNANDALMAADSAAYDFHRERFLAAADASGDRHWGAIADVVRGCFDLHEGRHDEARAHAEAAIASGIPVARDAAVVQLMIAGADQGRVEDIERGAISFYAGMRLVHPARRLGFVSYLMASRRFDEARAEMLRVDLDALPRDDFLIPALGLAADILLVLFLDDRERLARMGELLSPFTGLLSLVPDGAATMAPIDLHRGAIAYELGDRQGARRLTLAAYDLAASMRMDPWMVRLAVDLGRDYGREFAAESDRWAREALDGARRLSMAHQVELITGYLSTRGQAVLPPDAGPEPLTPREREILFLLAEGLTAASIADRLVISRRTVQKHIENIHGKSGASTRQQVIRFAEQQGYLGAPG